MADVSGSRRANDKWWDPEGVPPEKAIWNTVRHLRDEDGARKTALLRFTQLYANRPMQGLGPGEYHRVSQGDDDFQRLRLHLTRSLTEAVQAKIAKNKPKATVLTDGGDFTLQQTAKRLETYLWGQFWRSGLYDMLPQWFTDSAVWGTGVVKVTAPKGRVEIERVYPWELRVDPIEAYHGQPRSLFHERLIDRGVLRNMFPKKKDVINKAQKAKPDDMTGPDRLADQIPVVEAWHLPSGRDANDGAHRIAIEEDGGLLLKEDWQDERFPFAFLRWAQPPIGFWGDSLAEQVEGMEMEVQELLTKIQTSFYHLATPWLVMEQGADAQWQLDNRLGGVKITVKRNERPPFVQTHQTVGNEVFQHLDWLVRQAREDVGVGEMAATSQKPGGLDSGRALIEMNDIETERFVIRGQAFESGVMDVARLILLASRRAARQGHTVEVQARKNKKNGRKTVLEKIDFSDVDMQDDAFQLKMFPASSLPQSPAGRIQAVESLIQSGMLDREEALPLLDFPDVESVVSRKIAPYQLVVEIIEKMLEEGKMVTPEPFMDLDLGVRIMQQAYLDAKVDDVPEDRLELMRRWIQMATNLQQQAQAVQQAQVAPQGQPSQIENVNPQAPAVPAAPQGNGQPAPAAPAAPAGNPGGGAVA